MQLSTLIGVVETTAKAIFPGSSEAIAAGEAVIKMVNEVRPTLMSHDQAALDAALPDLLKKMNVDVDQVLKDLRGAA